jgi:hypothetical protein
MTDPIEQMPHEVFVIYLALPGMFTDDEIAKKIVASYEHAAAKERLELLQALQKIKPEGLSGPIRTAVRIINGLPPLDGD